MKREKAIELYHLKIWKFSLQVEDGWLSIHISFSPHHNLPEIYIEIMQYKNMN